MEENNYSVISRIKGASHFFEYLLCKEKPVVVERDLAKKIFLEAARIDIVNFPNKRAVLKQIANLCPAIFGADFNEDQDIFRVLEDLARTNAGCKPINLKEFVWITDYVGQNDVSFCEELIFRSFLRAGPEYDDELEEAYWLIPLERQAELMEVTDVYCGALYSGSENRLFGLKRAEKIFRMQLECGIMNDRKRIHQTIEKCLSFGLVEEVLKYEYHVIYRDEVFRAIVHAVKNLNFEYALVLAQKFEKISFLDCDLQRSAREIKLIQKQFLAFCE